MISDTSTAVHRICNRIEVRMNGFYLDNSFLHVLIRMRPLLWYTFGPDDKSKMTIKFFFDPRREAPKNRI